MPATKVTVTMYPPELAAVNALAKDKGFTRSLAIRRIIREWAEFKRDQLEPEIRFFRSTYQEEADRA